MATRCFCSFEKPTGQIQVQPPAMRLVECRQFSTAQPEFFIMKKLPFSPKVCQKPGSPKPRICKSVGGTPTNLQKGKSTRFLRQKAFQMKAGSFTRHFLFKPPSEAQNRTASISAGHGSGSGGSWKKGLMK